MGRFSFKAMKTNKPTNEQKIRMYEGFLHDINLAVTCCNAEMLNRLIKNADEFSYAHRVGNGEYSDEKQEQIIAAKFWRLREK